MHIRRSHLLMAASTLLALVGCASSDTLTSSPSPAVSADAAVPTTEPDAPSTTTLLDGLTAALQRGDLAALGQAVASAGMDMVDSPTFTFFAPTADAFRSLDAAELQTLLADPAELEQVLRNHLLEEKLTAADLATRSSVRTAAGHELPVVVEGDTLTVGGATVTSTDREAGGGLVHGIDALLVPEQ